MEGCGGGKGSAEIHCVARKAQRKCGCVSVKLERAGTSLSGGRFLISASGCGVDMGRLGAEAKSALLPSWRCKPSNQRVEA